MQYVNNTNRRQRGTQHLENAEKGGRINNNAKGEREGNKRKQKPPGNIGSEVGTIGREAE